MPDVTEINAITGEVIERDFTKEELAQRVADIKANEALKAAETKKFSDKESAMAKLAALGLTPEEIRQVLHVLILLLTFFLLPLEYLIEK